MMQETIRGSKIDWFFKKFPSFVTLFIGLTYFIGSTYHDGVLDGFGVHNNALQYGLERTLTSGFLICILFIGKVITNGQIMRNIGVVAFPALIFVAAISILARKIKLREHHKKNLRKLNAFIEEYIVSDMRKALSVLILFGLLFLVIMIYLFSYGQGKKSAAKDLQNYNEIYHQKALKGVPDNEFRIRLTEKNRPDIEGIVADYSDLNCLIYTSKGQFLLIPTKQIMQVTIPALTRR